MSLRRLSPTALALGSVLVVTLGCGSSGVGPTPLMVSSVVPNSGNPAGSTLLTIQGSGFQPGAIVTVGGTETTQTVVRQSSIETTTQAHAEGSVDVIVTNPDGQSSRLSAGFRYGAGANAPPTITEVGPNVGSTDGGAFFGISGTGFGGNGGRSSLVVTVAGIPLAVASATDTVIYVRDATPPHPAGPVDVVVINRDGQTVVAPGAYTYVLPQSFDFSGRWGGEDGSTGADIWIENNTLVRVSCGSGAPVALSAPAPVSNGAIAYAGADGITVAVRIVTPELVRGTIHIGACHDTDWRAERQR